MKTLAYGELRFDRRSILERLRDMSTWPAADAGALSAPRRETLKRRMEAMVLFLDGITPLSEIGNSCGVRCTELYRLFGRCIAMHEDGKIFGYRALVPYVHTEPYVRLADVSTARRQASGGASGVSGAFDQLLARYPEIARWLDRRISARRRRSHGLHEVRRRFRSLHRDFLKQCREAGIQAGDYPFNQRLLGERSLAAWVRRKLNRDFRVAAQDAGAAQIAHLHGGQAGELMRSPATEPFDVVEFDAHKIDIRLTLRIADPLGFETLLALNRIWVLVLIDVATRAVIGYSLALGAEYNRDDIGEALQAALSPHVTRPSRIPELHVRTGGGFPSEVIPGTAWACWGTLRYDAAKSHFANATLERLTEIVGCWTDNGPLGQKNERAFVERFFSWLAVHFAHRLPGTTGTDPHAVERLLNETGDMSLLMPVDEPEAVIDVVIADYNGEPHMGLGGRTPLEAMRFMLARRPDALRRLPIQQRSSLCMLQETRVVTVRGNVTRGVRPHINFEHVRYSSAILHNALLVGRQLRIYFNVKDIRQVRAFHMDGTELGVLYATGPWCLTLHSLRVRQEIFRLVHERKLRYAEGMDPVEAWFAYKKDQAQQHRRSANDLARMLTDRARAHERSPALTHPQSADERERVEPPIDPRPPSSPSAPPLRRLTRIYTS